jgi:hypothetical protein
MILYWDVIAAGEQTSMSKLSVPHVKNIVNSVWVSMIYALAKAKELA